MVSIIRKIQEIINAFLHILSGDNVNGKEERLEMADHEETKEAEQEAEPTCLRVPIVFPAGDLDAMIFHEEYTLPHSQR